MKSETLEEKVIPFFRFEDLRIYHKAIEYIEWVHSTTGFFPDSSNSSLSNQFKKAANAIALNIAEGSARNKSQFIYYLKMAKSSVRECLVYTTIAYKLNLLTDDTEQESRGVLMEMTKMIGALIGSLQRTYNGGNGAESENSNNQTHGQVSE